MDNRRGGFKGNQGQRDDRRGNFRDDQGPREMHKAVCADCGNECDVPFKPSGDRPVYCKDCFRKHKKF
ncbi:MAG: CxxC-x17-CxxC domain-containing protein [archaeon]